MAAVDGGDDRVEPAAVARLSMSNGYFLQGLYYGREYGPVTERTEIATIGREVPIKGLQLVSAVWGFTWMDEYTGIYTKAQQLPDGTTQQPIKDHEYNGGALVGVHLELFPKSIFKAHLGWESQLFPAGQAAIFLDLGIKEVFSFTVGVDL